MVLNEPLYMAHLLKEELRLWYASRPKEGQKLETFTKRMAREFDQWCHRVMYSRIPELKRFVRGLRKQRQWVLNYFVHRLTNGLTEGLMRRDEAWAKCCRASRIMFASTRM